ncbi:DNA ligase 1 [Nematocida minor]|uniref:DNA ligase 1 n=1 Tax=Nematocida minor TaxID=1912983 RepID=UPI00221F7DF3|nr:DNA ligase 1 [Nematocida minor]KAI5191697.1 DNA ligase 1 [Nematocida minor]
MQETWARAAACFEELSKVSSRKEMIKRLGEYFAPLDEAELVQAVYLSIARVSSESNGLEMNIGENILLKALSKFSATPVETLKKRMKEKGDISTVVTVSMRPRLFFIRKKALLLSHVFTALESIVRITGKEAALKKTEAIAELLAQCTTDEEVKYIIRIVDGKMKMGLSTQTVLCSLALALQKRFSNSRQSSAENATNNISNISGNNSGNNISNICGIGKDKYGPSTIGLTAGVTSEGLSSPGDGLSAGGTSVSVNSPNAINTTADNLTSTSSTLSSPTESLTSTADNLISTAESILSGDHPDNKSRDDPDELASALTDTGALTENTSALTESTRALSGTTDGLTGSTSALSGTIDGLSSISVRNSEIKDDVQIETFEEGGKIEWTEAENEIMEAMKEAYSQLPSFERLLKRLFKEGLSSLTSSLITPGYPLRPMLAMAEKDPETVAARFKEEYLVEYKYDGERVQAHCLNGNVELFSRGLENTTERFSQIIEPLKRANRTGKDFILDAEVVAYCRDTHKILSFQTLSNRKRKISEHNRNKEESEIALFIFDIIFLGSPLNKLPIKERKKILKESFTETKGQVEIATSHEFTSHNTERLQGIFTDSLAAGCEGVMVKSADSLSTYEPSKRSQKWIKLKSDYITGLHETLDLLVIGGYIGKGKRTGVYGGFLLGCINDLGEVETVTKIGTGFTEIALEEISKDLKELITDIPQADTNINNKPDVWFKPSLVWEVAAAGLSASPQYTAAKGAQELPEERGISLRFPRFIRKREDKNKETATSSEQILSMFIQTGGSNK